MKYSIFFITFVVMAAVKVSALPAEAIKPTSEIDDLQSHQEKHAHPVEPQQQDPFLPLPSPGPPSCPNAVCITCHGKKKDACLHRCAVWAPHYTTRPYPQGC